MRVRSVNGTAMAGSDYDAVAVDLTFPAGTTSSLVTVVTLDDNFAESEEQFGLVLEGASGADIGDSSETATIIDNEATVSVGNAAADEGDDLEFELNVVWPESATVVTPPDVVVTYQLVTYTPAVAQATDATPGSTCGGAVDYAMPTATATVTVMHPNTTATISVQTCEDELVEPDEQFWLELSTVTDAVADPAFPENGAVGTIRGDDIPVVSVSPAEDSDTEGTTLDFTVSLTVDGYPAQLTSDVTVNYRIIEDSRDGANSATAPVPGRTDHDLEAASAGALTGTLTFTPGPPAVTEHLIEVVLRDDHEREEPETFLLDLHDIVDTIGLAVFEDRDSDPATDDSYAVGTILDNPPPELSVADFSGPEGSVQAFIVSLAYPRDGETVTVQYEITGEESSNGDTATAPNHPTKPADFEPVAPATLAGTLTFAPGTTRHDVKLSLLHDTINENADTLRLTLQNPDNAILFDRDPDNGNDDEPYGVGTIIDVDPPWLIVDNPDADESLTLGFTVTVCNRRMGDTVTVDYETVDHNAEAGLDYDAVSGTLTFNDLSPSAIAVPTAVCGVDAVTAQSHSVGVSTIADAVAENDETLHLVLSNPLNAALGGPVGVGTINNVDAASVVVTDPAPAEEGQSLIFTIAVKESRTGLEPTILTPVTVYYVTADRTAAADGDYTSLPRTQITFHTGSDTHEVAVQTLTDTEDENDETFALVLSDVSPHAAIGDTEGTGTIIDGHPPALRIDDARATETAGHIDFRVHLVDPDDPLTAVTTDKAVRVWAESVSGTATATAGTPDYTHRQDYVEIPAGQSEATFSISVIEDGIDEGPETFTVELSQPSNASIDRAFAVGTIEPECVDIHTDDARNRPPVITFYDTEVIEDNQAFDLDASFSRVPCEEVTLRWAYAGGTTTPLVDHPGYSHVTFPIVIIATNRRGITSPSVYADDLHEGDETINFELNWAPSPGMPSHYQGIPPAFAQVTVIDDDPPPSLRISDASGDEGEVLTFEVTLDTASGLPVNVEYRTVPNSSATPGTDYTPVSQWTPLVIDPGDTSETFDVATPGPRRRGRGRGDVSGGVARSAARRRADERRHRGRRRGGHDPRCRTADAAGARRLSSRGAGTCCSRLS